MKRKVRKGIVKGAVSLAMACMLVSSVSLPVLAEEETAKERTTGMESDSGKESGKEEKKETDIVMTEEKKEEAASKETKAEIKEETKEEIKEETESENKGQPNDTAQAAQNKEMEEQQECPVEEMSINGQEELQRQNATITAVEQIQEEIDALEAQVSDTVLVVEAENGEEEYELIVGTKTDEKGTVQKITMQEYVDKQTSITENVKAELENALKEDATAEEVEKYVQAAQKAAANVYNTAWKAEQVYNDAEKTFMNEVKKYNAYAKKYGYDLMEYHGKALEYETLELSQMNLQEGDIQHQLEAVQGAKATAEAAREANEAAQLAAVAAVENAAVVSELAENQAAENYEQAKVELQELLVQSFTTKPDLTSFQKELKKKVKALENAENDLNKIQQQKYDTQSYLNWAQTLLKAKKEEITTRVYGQLELDSDTDIGYANDQGFDETDSTVKSQDKQEFTEVTVGPQGVTVPYEVFRAYVASMYDRVDAEGDLIRYLRHGLGIAVNGEEPDATMPEIYWAFDVTTQQIDPARYFVKTTGEQEYPEWMTAQGSTYFKGYSFKYEDDGYYHLDGYLCVAAEDANPNPDKAPDSEPTKTPITDMPEEPAPLTDMPEEPTPLADMPEEPTPLTDMPEEPTPLADMPEEPMPLADMPKEPIPLDAVPRTGDAAAGALPIGMGGSFAIAAGIIANRKRKSQS